MQCASPPACSTSASWSSSSGGGTFFRDAASWQLSGLLSFRHSLAAFHSLLIVEEHQSRVFPVVFSLSAAREKKKKRSSNLVTDSAPAPAVSSPPFYQTASPAADEDLKLSSSLSHGLQSLPSLKSDDPAWDASKDGTPVGTQIKGGRSTQRGQWTWVNEEVTHIVLDFLESQGLSSAHSVTAVKTAPTFISHLLSLLKSFYPASYLSGKELSRNEIKSVLLPYLESLDDMVTKDVGIVSKSSKEPDCPHLADFVPYTSIPSKVLCRHPLLLECLVDGKLPPFLSYCLSLGLSPAQVEATVKKFPPIVGYSFERKIGKVVAFILSLEVSPSLIPQILLKRPQLFGCNVEENLKPSVDFLETLGVDHMRWGKILVAFPHMLTYSCSKYSLVVNFLMENGVSKVGAGRVLSKFPHVVGYSVECKLRPMVEYFHSIGIEDFSRIITRSPQTLGLSLEKNIKPTVDYFFSSLDFSMEEIALVLSRFPQILGLNVEHNLQPKWQFFLEMKFSREELVDFPQYFGYSLEKRIQPRYKIIVESQVTVSLNRMLSMTTDLFSKLVTSRVDRCRSLDHLEEDVVGGMSAA